MISRRSIFTILSLGFFVGCTGGSPDDGTALSRAAVSCTTSADCAAGFECTAEPQGNFCKQHEAPEREADHGEADEDHGDGGVDRGERHDGHGGGEDRDGGHRGSGN